MSAKRYEHIPPYVFIDYWGSGREQFNDADEEERYQASEVGTSLNTGFFSCFC